MGGVLDEPTAASAGAKIGRYELRAPLGHATDGASYAATRDGARFELRRLEPNAVDDALRRRVLLLRGLRHDAVLTVHEVRLAAEPPMHVAVSAIDGTWAEPAHWPRRSADLVETVAVLVSGLAAAHQRGIVHGALGPAHVVVADGRVKLDLDGTRTRARGPAARAPEMASDLVPTAAADVWGLGEAIAPVIERIDEHDERLATVAALVAKMRQADPDARPAARELAHLLSDAAPTLGGGPAPSLDSTVPERLGPYTLVGRLGTGGMGAVYRAKDEAGGPDVALKVLLPETAANPLSLARFRREARLLAQVDSPHIARFLAANMDQGWHYLAMELVEGTTAHAALEEYGPFEVEAALCLAEDVARALADVHAHELVHRDVKPANLLLLEGTERGDAPRAKLCDFGIARATAPGDEQVTRQGSPGTPSYMSPEQVRGAPLDARSDVYSFGASLFTLLACEPIYIGGPHLVMAAHVAEPPPDVRTRLPGLPEPVATLLDRCLAKEPDARFADGAALREAIAETRRGEALSTSVLPQPIDLEGKPVTFSYAWELDSSPQQLWPHVSNTERLNRAIGLDDVDWSHEATEGGGVHREGQFRAAGMLLRWTENPYEWVAPRRLGVVREYSRGPFEWLRSQVDLAPREGGGTTLKHTIEIRPRNAFGRVAASVEIGMRVRRGLQRVYRRIDAACRIVAEREPGQAVELVDPFETPGALSVGGESRLESALAKIVERGADPHVARTLGDFVREAPAPRLARLRPLAWAAEHGFAGKDALRAMLLAAHEGLLQTLWDILCPTCRIPSQFEDSIRAVGAHGRCEACDLDFELDLARSVELVFRVDPRVREADLGVYCIGGPAHSPHVVAQVRLAPGQRFRLDVKLPEGGYCVTGRGVPRAHRFRVARAARLHHWSLPLREGLDPLLERSLGTGEQRIELVNDLAEEVVVRLERTAARSDAVTAADAASNGLFRSLFPSEVLAPEQLVGVSHVALLFVAIPDVEARYAETEESDVYRELVELHGAVQTAAEREGGALVKLHLDGVLAVFGDAVSATRCGLRLIETERPPAVAVHAGSAMMATINDRLDYFGRTVHMGGHLLAHARAGEMVVSDEAMGAPGTGMVLSERATAVGAAVVGTTIGSRYAPGVPA